MSILPAACCCSTGGTCPQINLFCTGPGPLAIHIFGQSTVTSTKRLTHAVTGNVREILLVGTVTMDFVGLYPTHLGTDGFGACGLNGGIVGTIHITDTGTGGFGDDNGVRWHHWDFVSPQVVPGPDSFDATYKCGQLFAGLGEVAVTYTDWLGFEPATEEWDLAIAGSTGIATDQLHNWLFCDACLNQTHTCVPDSMVLFCDMDPDVFDGNCEVIGGTVHPQSFTFPFGGTTNWVLDNTTNPLITWTIVRSGSVTLDFT